MIPTLKKYKRLEEFVQDQNRWLTILSKEDECMPFPLSQSHVNRIAHEIDIQLSPENLHCDGEISAHEAQSKGVRLMKVVDALRVYCKDQNLKTPTIWEAWD